MFPRPMRVPIIMPQLGESIAEATIVNIAVQVGEHVKADQEIIEVETNKALLQVTTPCAGELLELLVQPQETYAVGTTLGYVEAAPEEVARLGLQPMDGGESGALMGDVEPGTANAAGSGHGNGNGRHEAADVPTRAEQPTDGAAGREPAVAQPTLAKVGLGGGLPVPARLTGAGYLSPRIKARVAELGLQAADLAGVAGTGAGGRVTVDDLEKFLADLDTRTTRPAPAMRVAVGDAMRRSWARPLATVGRSARLDALLAHRKMQPEPKPGVVLYVIRALALALAEDNTLASRLIGKRLVPAAAVDIGFAVEVDDGLMVPVLRSVDTVPVGELNQQYQDLVAAARRRQLPPGTTGNAAATVTNFGTFGLIWATPIPLPDETLMLGLGAGQKVPVWDEEKGDFVPVTEAEITLSFDHRALDGGSAGRLLASLAKLLSEPEKL